MKHRAIKIVLGSGSGRVVVRPGGATVWDAASSILQGCEGTVTFEIHYDDAKVFVGHMIPAHGDRDVGKCMRKFCEFYALRRLPSTLQNKESFRRFIRRTSEHQAAVEWLRHYEIGHSHHQDLTESNATMSSHVTPSWTPA